ncbi:hypothetical protein OS965_42285, partial [Streptomyces sp. H27-G5]|uniref:ISAzo13-like element transposase-related protein n=1 Tax=Streptomyces sp. H27-G5 TaxID=2996698 RepID=UPI002274F7E7|nr:hypothetical protein [Streptomyces sp. H27-G5]
RAAEAPRGRLDQQARPAQTGRANDPGTGIERPTCLDHVDRLRAERDTGSYPRGIRIPDREMKILLKQHVTPHEFHGEWNYTITATDTPD